MKDVHLMYLTALYSHIAAEIIAYEPDFLNELSKLLDVNIIEKVQLQKI